MARLLKLKYCPECGSFVKLNYGNGAVYWAITWKCTAQACVMSKESRPLHGWNEENKPNKWALWAGIINEINWRAQIEQYGRS